MLGRTPHPTALNAARRRREIAALAERRAIDLLVVGGGASGAGVALDAAARGLSVALVEAHDLAFGTSRFSSKLAHGGLRYLASGQWAIAHESAAERHLLMTRIAPHLTRPLAQVMPLHGSDAAARGAFVGTGYVLGDGLRRMAGTPSGVLPAPRAIRASRVSTLAPAVRRDGLRAGVLGWDGQLIDDARLVVDIARTAAGFGALILTRMRALSVRGDGAELRDELTGERMDVSARAVVNATGVWAGALDGEVSLRPSRGTHLVLDSARFGGSDVSLTAPVPGTRSRFVFTVPAVHGRTYVGLTDVPAGEDVPEVASASPDEVETLRSIVSTVLERPVLPGDVLGTFSGLRPLLAGADGETSDLSRRHEVRENAVGVLTLVGGKLTTYRRMAEDAVDAVIGRGGWGECPASSTARIPLVGAWPRQRRAELAGPERLVRRYGAEAGYVAALPEGPGAARGVTAQELQWAVRVEGALDAADVLDRRTRLGLVDADRAASESAVAAAFDRSAQT